MAENKKSFLLYCDLIHTVNRMPNDKAGELFKLILSYVNDEKPNIDEKELLIQLAFEPIRQSLKRDLQRYLNITERNRINGSKGGRPKKPTGLTGNPKKPKKADSDNDSDSDSDSESESEIFNFKKSLIKLNIENQIIEDWLKVRKAKKAVNTETSFNSILKEINKTNKTANECIKISVENNWAGFKAEWLTNNNYNNNSNQPVKLKAPKKFEGYGN